MPQSASRSTYNKVMVWHALIGAAAMITASPLRKPLRNQRKKAILFVGIAFNFHSSRCISTTALEELKTHQETHANAISIFHGEVGRLCKQGRLKEALYILRAMDYRGIPVNSSTYASILHECVNKEALSDGKRVHAHIIQTGFECQDVFLGNTLINMYAKGGSLKDARRVLDQMPQRNVVSWSIIVAAYARHGRPEEALTLFYKMQRTGVQPNHFTYASVLPACANLAALKKVHEEVIRSGLKSDIIVGNTLIDMYAKNGSIESARNVFDEIPQRDVVSWNAIIAGYAQNGYVDEALELFEKMPKRDVVSWTTLIAGYVQNGLVDEALNLFQKMPERDVISWNAMIAGYAQNGCDEEALKLYRQMQLAGLKPNTETFSSVLPSCANLIALEHGKAIHEDIIRSGFQCDVFVGSALVDMYAKCGSLGVACQVFDKMPSRDVVSWNAMIAGHAHNGDVDEAQNLFQKMPERNVVSWNVMIAGCTQNGHGIEALKLYRQMLLAGGKPNSETFTVLLPVCANLAALEVGKELHEDIIRSGLQSDVFVGSALVDMYAKCGRIENALMVFEKMPQLDMVLWNAMISGYGQSGHVGEALKLFKKMPRRDAISWNVMIAGYAQNGNVDEALELFQKMPGRDAVSWNVMIAGCSQNGYVEEAQKLYRQMQLTGVKPNSETFVIVLPACANLAVLEQGKEIHGVIIKSGFQSYVFVGCSLVDMYAKCGSLEDARKVFDKLPRRDVVLWTTMIAGYAMNGCGKEALQLFEQMQHSGMKPDHVTFVGVLSACCHAGLVADGWRYFHDMSQYYDITPAMEHYCCMVDLLGRAGQLVEAQDFIHKMPIKPDAAVWVSLLGACRIHANIELAECAAERLFELEPKNASPYVLLSNIYAAAGRWDDAEKVREMMKDRRVKRNPGCSWIEINKQVYDFFAGDRSHPQMQKIYAKLERLSEQMKAAGYVPDTRFVLNNVEEEHEDRICSTRFVLNAVEKDQKICEE
eukprot:Gb_01246 [translate_table: standard]